jgi:hypothetical protein
VATAPLARHLAIPLVVGKDLSDADADTTLGVPDGQTLASTAKHVNSLLWKFFNTGCGHVFYERVFNRPTQRSSAV